MHTHDNPDHDPDAVAIPRPRKRPDDDIDNLPKMAGDQPVWWYDQNRKRGRDYCYSGQINHISSAEGERLRGELADVIRDLLDWAAQQQTDKESTEDGEAG